MMCIHLFGAGLGAASVVPSCSGIRFSLDLLCMLGFPLSVISLRCVFGALKVSFTLLKCVLYTRCHCISTLLTQKPIQKMIADHTYLTWRTISGLKSEANPINKAVMFDSIFGGLFRPERMTFFYKQSSDNSGLLVIFLFTDILPAMSNTLSVIPAIMQKEMSKVSVFLDREYYFLDVV